MKRIWIAIGLIFFLITVLKNSQFALQRNSLSSDFTVYFTGNVRGNLEPCG
ncbi:MAG: hypothetical protein MK025_04200 [Acidobacteriia bacterium]|nr:hypothetical protein [Terriglobia bacterium]